MTLRTLICHKALLVVAVLMASCSANHKAIYRHQQVDAGAWITTTDAKQRAILSSNDKTGEARRFCAEPSPDVFAVIAQSLSVGGSFGQQADPKAIQAALNAAFSSSEQGSTIPRTQTINMLRELMYRTCERFLNDGITSLELPLQAIRDQRLMVSILAIEQLTGVVSSRAVALGAMAEASAGASTTGAMAVLDKARTELKAKAAARDEAQTAYKLKALVKKDGADKEVEACVALDNAKTAADKQALPQEVKDKTADCGELSLVREQTEADYKEAKLYFDKQSKLADASGIPVSATSSLMTPTTLEGFDQAAGGRLGDVSDVVRQIVQMNFDQDEFKFLCLKVLSGELPPRQQKLVTELWAKCMEYANEKINADLQLTKQRVDAQMGKLLAASNSQFETFWGSLSTRDGKAIDPARLQAAQKRSAALIAWPSCFNDKSTKEEARNCFLEQVKSEREDLVKAASPGS